MFEHLLQSQFLVKLEAYEIRSSEKYKRLELEVYKK